MIKKLTIYFLFLSILFTQFSISEEKFLSLKKNKVNVRYGPSFDSKIKYIYKKINLPIKQIDKKENFRRIVDLKNNSGWIHILYLVFASSLSLSMWGQPLAAFIGGAVALLVVMQLANAQKRK